MKPKSKPRSKEELLNELKNKAEFKEKLSFIKEKFYPALINATTTVDDAVQNLYLINTVLMEKFLGKMKDMKMRDLNIYTNLSVSDPKYNQLKTLLELFDDMDVFTAKTYFEGVKQEIETFKSDVFKEMPLSELKTKWIDEL